jgi:(S)-3,5-dihydroxyphenylglycine transaminase
MAVVRAIEISERCYDPLLDAMLFLNEVVADFPGAISFGPGRPIDSPAAIDDHAAALDAFVDHAARRSRRGREAILLDLAQYARLEGLIGDVIAGHLERDERIHVRPEDIIVTVGAQEAMAIVLMGLMEPATDILLVSDPTYVGMTGLAHLLGITIVPVPSGDGGLDPEAVERAIVAGARRGRVRALYDIPDFNNPLGTSLSVPDRLELLRVCERHGVLIVEDNAYGMFAYDHPAMPTLKSLDTGRNVVYIGSFAKTLYPGLRVGYLVADQRAGAGRQSLAAALSRVKGLLTVNTPALPQAIAGGLLLLAGGSLEPIVAPKRECYKGRRDALLAALADTFSAPDGVSWSSPPGGFFLPMTLPFELGEEEARRCAEQYGVIAAPMRFFCMGAERRRQVRLSFSSVEPSLMHEGVSRLAAFIRHEAPARARRMSTAL